MASSQKEEGVVERALRKSGMLPLKEACVLHGVSEITVGGYARDGKLGKDTIQVATRWWVNPSDVAALKPIIERNRERPSVQKMRAAPKGKAPPVKTEGAEDLLEVLRSREGQEAVGAAVIGVLSNATVVRLLADSVASVLIEGDVANRVPSLRSIVEEVVREAVK